MNYSTGLIHCLFSPAFYSPTIVFKSLTSMAGNIGLIYPEHLQHFEECLYIQSFCLAIPASQCWWFFQMNCVHFSSHLRINVLSAWRVMIVWRVVIIPPRVFFKKKKQSRDGQGQGCLDGGFLPPPLHLAAFHLLSYIHQIKSVPPIPRSFLPYMPSCFRMGRLPQQC